jgi:hypothetical protein
MLLATKVRLKATGQRHDAWNYQGPPTAPAAKEGGTPGEYAHLVWRLCHGPRSSTHCVPSLKVLDYWVQLHPGDWYVDLPSGLSPVPADQFHSTFEVVSPDDPEPPPPVSYVAVFPTLTRMDADQVIRITWTDLGYTVRLFVDEARHIVTFGLLVGEGLDETKPPLATGGVSVDGVEFHPSKFVAHQDLEVYALAWSRAIRAAKRAWKDTVK